MSNPISPTGNETGSSEENRSPDNQVINQQFESAAKGYQPVDRKADAAEQGISLSGEVKRTIERARKMATEFQRPLNAAILMETLCQKSLENEKQTSRAYLAGVLKGHDAGDLLDTLNQLLEERTGDQLPEHAQFGTEEVAGLLKEADRIAKKTSKQQFYVSLRHLFVATLTNITTAHDYLNRLSLDPKAMRVQYLDHLWEQKAIKDDIIAWEEVLVDGDQIAREALFTKNGAEVFACITPYPWLLQQTAIAVSIAPGFDLTGSVGAWLKRLPADERTHLLEEVFKRVETNSIPEDPVLVPLDKRYIHRLLPNAPEMADEHGVFLIAVTDTSSESITDLRKLTYNVVKLASESGVQELVVLPLSGDHEEHPRTAARQMTHGIWAAAQNLVDAPLPEITLILSSAGILQGVRDKVHLLTRNRPQEVWGDQPADEDLLGIKEEVDALAETLLLRKVKPPLSVAVLGGWGSGKSTVMRLMMQRITRARIERTRKGWPDEDTVEGVDDLAISSKVGHIYQIQFNAWTYAKSNLWASLMQTIFGTLNRQLTIEKELIKWERERDDSYSVLEKRDRFQFIYDEYGWVSPGKWKKLHRDVRDIIRSENEENELWQRLRARHRITIQKLNDKEEEIAELKARREIEEAARKSFVIRELGQESHRVVFDVFLRKSNVLLGDLYEGVVQGVNTQSDEIAVSAQELFTNMRSISTTVDKTKQVYRQHRGMSTVIVVAGLILFILAGLLLTNNFFGLVEVLPEQLLESGSRFFTGITLAAASAVTLLGPPLKIAASWSKRIGELAGQYQEAVEAERERYQSLVESRLAEMKASDEMTWQQLPAQDEDPDSSGVDRRINLANIDHQINQLENEVEELRRMAGPPAEYDSLIAFVQSRQNQQAYEKRLGLMHQVKQDIDFLTDGLVVKLQDPKEVVEEKRKQFPRGPARVILYIDDLDRCPPNRVVEVLEAVQLLLHTELFVVVFGLDTRYITRALEKEYKEILQADGDPSGLDYIEKIVQLPYRVRPISDQGLENFLGRMMEVAEDEYAGDLSEEHLPEELDPPIGEHNDVESPPVSLEEEGSAGNEPGVVDEGDEIPKAGLTEIGGEVKKIGAPPAQDPEDVLPDYYPEEIPPKVIRFQPEDVSALNACCQILNLTPRSVKRLVNVLKLIDVFWFRTDRDLHGQQIKGDVMAMLALAAAYPVIMREVFNQIDMHYRNKKSNQNLQVAALLDIEDPLRSEFWQDLDPILARRFGADVAALKSSNGLEKSLLNATLNELGLDTFNLVRSFSFVGDPVNIGDDGPGTPSIISAEAGIITGADIGTVAGYGT